MSKYTVTNDLSGDGRGEGKGYYILNDGIHVSGTPAFNTEQQAEQYIQTLIEKEKGK